MNISFGRCVRAGMLLSALLFGSVVRASDLDSSLIAVAKTGDVNRVKALLAQGADVNAKADKRGFTALHIAALAGDKDIVEVLLANKADVNAGDGLGGTPLICAAMKGHVGILKVLLAHGANVNATSHSQMTALMAAAATGQKEAVEILLSQGANVNATNEDRWSSLLFATLKGHEAVVEVLLANKADVNARTMKGETPLWWAALNRHKDIVGVLLAHKADVDASDKDGETALFVAALEGQKEIVEVLLTYGADVYAKTAKGTTPLNAATRHKDVLEVMKNHLAKTGKTAKRQLAGDVSTETAPQTASSNDTTIQIFSGSGGRNTRPFTVKDSWEIQWDATGDIFQITLYRSDGEMEGIAANQMGAGKGASYQPKGGQYYLGVNSIGNWTIKIVQTENKSSK